MQFLRLEIFKLTVVDHQRLVLFSTCFEHYLRSVFMPSLTVSGVVCSVHKNVQTAQLGIQKEIILTFIKETIVTHTAPETGRPQT